MFAEVEVARKDTNKSSAKPNLFELCRARVSKTSVKDTDKSSAKPNLFELCRARVSKTSVKDTDKSSAKPNLFELCRAGVSKTSVKDTNKSGAKQIFEYLPCISSYSCSWLRSLMVWSSPGCFRKYCFSISPILKK